MLSAKDDELLFIFSITVAIVAATDAELLETASFITDKL